MRPAVARCPQLNRREKPKIGPAEYTRVKAPHTETSAVADRVKFSVEWLEDRLPVQVRQSGALEELMYWCGVFHELGLAPVNPDDGCSVGNLSMRSGSGIVITASSLHYKDVACLTPDDFFYIESFDEQRWIARVRGPRLADRTGETKKPSSDTPLHTALYSLYVELGIEHECRAVFHGHDPLILKHTDRLNLPGSRCATHFGTRDDLDEIRHLVRTERRTTDLRSVFVRRNHGFFTIGRTALEAGLLVVGYHGLAELEEERETRNGTDQWPVQQREQLSPSANCHNIGGSSTDERPTRKYPVL